VANNESETPGASAGSSSAGARTRTRAPRKSSAGRKPAAKKPAARSTRRPARRPARGAGALANLLKGLSRQASRTGTRIAALSEQGVSGARRTLRQAGVRSQKTIDRLAKEWKGMDTARRAQFVAALLATLAAASAPIVRSRWKKK
jgi:hypothetical protein